MMKILMYQVMPITCQMKTDDASNETDSDKNDKT